MIALADCNNFYASCERVFNPKLEKKPVIVLSNNDGCVIARSNEVKEMGIKMGEPAFKIKSIIEKNKINVFSSNLNLYGDLSNRVMTTFKTEIDKIEVYSIDEAFLDFSDFADKERALHIKNKVQKWTGIPICIGVAKTKTLAKVANHIAKKYTKSGVFILDNEDLVIRTLNFLKVEDLWGIGRKTAKKLNNLGIYTALQLRKSEPKWIRKHFSITGLKLQKELKGEVCFPVELSSRRKKNICTARSFAGEIKEINKLKEAISSHANTCSEKLRIEKSCCSKISIFLNTNPYKKQIIQHHPFIILRLDVPTNDSIEIIKFALKGLEKIHHINCFYKKAGVIVGGIIPENKVQFSLFDNLNREKRRNINSTIDVINKKMGRDKVKLAVQGNGRKWKLKKEKLSPCYTTRFTDMLEVRI